MSHTYYYLGEFYDKFHKTAFSPKAVQRKVCWESENKNNWIGSLNNNAVWPSAIIMVNVSESYESAKKHGVNSIVRFFNLETADEVLKTHGKANAILAANVMCHIPNLNEIAESAFNLLTDDGVLIFEDPYLGEMIEKVSYDQIYDAHIFIFSLQQTYQYN